MSSNAEPYVSRVARLAGFALLALIAEVILLLIALFGRFANPLQEHLRTRRMLGASFSQLAAPLAWPLILLIPMSTLACLPAIIYALHLAGTVFGSDLPPLSRLHTYPLFVLLAMAACVTGSIVGLCPSIWRAMRPARPTVTPTPRWLWRGMLSGVAVGTGLTLATIAAALVHQVIRIPGVVHGPPWDRIYVLGIDSGLMRPRSGSAPFGSEIVRAVAGIPEVRAVAWMEALGFFATPYHHSAVWPVSVENTQPAERTAVLVGVSDGWDKVLRLTPIEGRLFSIAEHEQSSPVAVITETVAQEWWPSQAAVGRRLVIRRESPTVEKLQASRERLVTVVGVVKDWYTSPTTVWPSSRPVIVPRPRTYFDEGYLIVDSSVPATSAALASRRAIDAALPGTPIRLQTDFVTLLRSEFGLMSVLAKMFVTLAALGLGFAFLCVVASAYDDVASRARELGIRLALGATNWSLTRVVLGRYVVVIAATCTVASLFVSWAFTFVQKAILAALLGRPGVTFGSAYALVPAWVVVVVFGAVVGIAAAWRVAHMNPAAALRQDEA